MTTETRRRRGRESERIVAEHVRRIWPTAEATPPGQYGTDVRRTPGAAIEVKSRRGLNLLAWMRQAKRNAMPGALPLLVVRLDGQGPATVGDWPVVLRLDDLLDLIERSKP